MRSRGVVAFHVVVWYRTLVKSDRQSAEPRGTALQSSFTLPARLGLWLSPGIGLQRDRR